MTSAKKTLCLAALLASLWAVCPISPNSLAYAQAQPAQPSSQTAEKPAEPAPADHTEPKHETIGGELAKQEREAEGAEEEENANLKHSTMVQKLAKVTGMSVHQAHLAAMIANFAVIVFIVVWFGRKSIPAMMRNRTASIQRALEEARAASQEANQRLADIESRLRQMDVEIGKMQQSAEKEAESEEGRIQKAAEEEMRRIVQAAEQEIAAAAKQARRELSTHTADLAIALARKQISVDTDTDQVLVRNFASKLATKPSQGDGGKGSN